MTENGRKPKILYVEDDTATRELMSSFLKNEASELQVASRGEEGIELFRNSPADLVITDLQMPGMGGIEMIKTLRALKPDIPVIVTTAYGDANHLFEVVQLQVNGFVIKPLELMEIRKLVRKLAAEIEQYKTVELNRVLLEQYKHAVDAGTIVSKTDEKGRITYANEAFCDLSGYTKEELIGRPHNIVRHPDMPSETFREMWDTIKSGRVWKGIVKNLRKDGESYTVEATIFPILRPDGSVQEYIGLRHDITELEQYREILETQLDATTQGLTEKIHLIAEYEKAMNAGTLFLRLDREHKIRYVNKTMAAALGMDQETLTGQFYVGTLTCTKKESSKEEIRELLRLIEEKKEHAYYTMCFEGKGRKLTFAVTFIPILNMDDEVQEILAIHHDISEIIALNDEIAATQREVVETMGAIGEARSKETGEHVRRVADYSYLLARLAGIDEEEALLLKMASPMHDIGKVGIPDAILHKPGKLTDEEYTIMKTHAGLGQEMLGSSNREILKAAAVVAGEHHEKWDGSGYPKGAAGENIHIYGRITALADVFDALGHDRVYKKAWPMENILKLIKEGRGSHFDPRLVDLFLENLDQFLAIKRRYDGEAM